MDFLRTAWPFSFMEKPAVSNLIVMVILYTAASFVITLVLSILGHLPGIGGVFRVLDNIISPIIGAYCTAGIVFTFLNYFKVGAFANEPKEED